MASLCFIALPRLIGILQSVGTESGMFVSVVNSEQLGVGRDPLQPAMIIDLMKEEVKAAPIGEDGADRLAPAAVSAGRTRGRYWFEILGRPVECRSKKYVLLDGLRAIERERPGALDKLTQIKLRSRRIVSRARETLFTNPNLLAEIERYSERLDNTWWVGTNNSGAEASAWLDRACQCAGLKWGQDFRSSLSPSLDDLAL